MTAPELAHFEALAGKFRKALAVGKDTHSLEDVQARIESGHAVYWPGPTSAIVTEIIDYPQHRQLNFWLAVGNVAELRTMYPAICEWGRTQGCVRATLNGRAGWARSLFAQGHGWEEQMRVFTREL